MDLLALSDIAKRTGIPAPSARRYAALFRDFLAGRKLGRVTRYPEESVAVFRRIARLYADGRITAEIEDILHREFPRTIEVGPADAPIPLPAVAADSTRLAEDLSTALSGALSGALSTSMDRVSEALDRLTAQKSGLEASRADIAKLKSGFVLLARSVKRLSLRDPADTAALVDRLSERVRSMEPRLAVMEEITLTLTNENADLKARISAQEVELRRMREDCAHMSARLKRLEGPRD